MYKIQDERWNGLVPGGFEGKPEEKRNEVHAATLPPGLPGTTVSRLPGRDVLISIDLKSYIRDGGVAYESKSGVILFPNKILKKYIIDAVDRRKNVNLIRQPRQSSYKQRTQSSREDKTKTSFCCPRCFSENVNQFQSPWHWPGSEICGHCSSETSFEALKIKSLKNERTADTEETEETIKNATENTED